MIVITKICYEYQLPTASTSVLTKKPGHYGNFCCVRELFEIFLLVNFMA